MLRPVLLVLPLCAALTLLPAGASARTAPPAGPSGQFVPTAGDRDGDGLPDAADCAPDDPSRPARTGVDADCDGVPDSGLSPITISGPADGGPDPAGQHSASSTVAPAVDVRARARRALGGAVVASGLRLGAAVAAFAPRRERRGLRTFVFVARDNAGLTAAPSLDGHRLAATHRSLARGAAYVLRIRTGAARRLRIVVTVVDASGNRRRAARTLRLR